MKLIQAKDQETLIAAFPSPTQFLWKLTYSSNLDPGSHYKKLSLQCDDTRLDLCYEAKKISASFDQVEVGKKPRSFRVDGHTHLIYLISGEARCTVYPGEQQFTLKRQSTLYFTNEDLKSDDLDEILIHVESKTSTSRLFLIELGEALISQPPTP
jgi:AAA15 family ATPase/GTPase